jgi:putative ABC transport system permease protein
MAGLSVKESSGIKMKLDELTSIALGNLWRTKLRTLLTTIGVIIGIGALVSMISFGTGTQKNVTAAFYENDLFTSMFVTLRDIDINDALSGNIQAMTKTIDKPPPPLNDSTLKLFQVIPGVESAFPEIRIPAKLKFLQKTTELQVRALPAQMGKHKPFNDLLSGQFFSNDSASGIVLTPDILKKLNIKLMQNFQKNLPQDSLGQYRFLDADSLIGDTLELITSVPDFQNILQYSRFLMQGQIQIPFRENSTRLTICGIQKQGRSFDDHTFLSGAVIPIKTADLIPRTEFNDIWDVLSGRHEKTGYASVIIRMKHVDFIESVQDSLKSLGYSTFSILDQLSEIKKGFLIFDMGLGAIGTIALIVAALGIINTMVMSILERTREIGIMKAIGGSEGDIRSIFFIEAGTIGFFGGIMGLGLGWLVTKIANAVANHYFMREIDFTIQFFYIPLWLILGAIGFSVIVSLLAGIYPASRAASINPVEALRHD